jgi:hypothetical protein
MDGEGNGAFELFYVRTSEVEGMLTLPQLAGRLKSLLSHVDVGEFLEIAPVPPDITAELLTKVRGEFLRGK